MASPATQLASALKNLTELPQTTLLACSRVFESEPLAGMNQPNYLNGVVEVKTTLTPWALLRSLKRIEQLQGRQKNERWGSRALDLDILLFGDQQLSDPQLQIPHAGNYMRIFVLQPLHDIAPDLQFPDGSALTQRLRECPALNIQAVNVDEFKLP